MRQNDDHHENPLVRIEGLHKYFGPHHVLRGIDLTVNQGEVSVVIGPSGSGKSTMLRCVNLLETISAGRIYVGGQLIGYRDVKGRLHDLKAKEIAAQRREIGMVFQRFNLFPHKTALQNIMEAPVQVKGQSKAARPEARRWSCWTAWAWRTAPTTTRRSSPAASSSAWPLPGRWPWTRSSCSSTSPPRRWTRSWWATS